MLIAVKTPVFRAMCTLKLVSCWFRVQRTLTFDSCLAAWAWCSILDDGCSMLVAELVTCCSSCLLLAACCLLLAACCLVLDARLSMPGAELLGANGYRRRYLARMQGFVKLTVTGGAIC